MLKTLKRKIALVAVAGLGFGVISTVPAFAASAGTLSTLGLRAGASNAVNIITLTTTDVPDAQVTDADNTTKISARVLTAPAGVDLTSTNFDFTGSAAVGAADDIAAGETFNVAMGAANKTAFPVPGDYLVYVWVDTDGNGTAAAAEDYFTTTTVTVGGAAISATLDTTSGSAVAASAVANNQKLATITLKDSAGRTTMLSDLPAVLPETLAISGTNNLGAALTMNATGHPAASLSGKNMTLALTGANLPAGANTYTYKITNAGALTTAFSATYTLSAKAAGVVGATVLSTADAAKSVAAANAAVQLSTEAIMPIDTNTVTITATSTAADLAAVLYVSGTVAGIKVNGLSVTAGAIGTGTAVTAITGADSKATFVITFTAATANQTFNLSDAADANAGATDGVALTFVAPAVTVGAGSTITVSPASGSAVIAATGGTVPVKVTVADQFSNPVAGYTVRATNTDAAGTAVNTIGTSGADGTVTLNVAAPSATATAGTITLFANAPGVASAAINGGTTITVTYQADPSPTTLLAGFADVAGTATSDRITLTSTTSMMIETVSTGVATDVATAAQTTANGVPEAGKNAVRLYANSVASSLVTFTGSAGVCITTTNADTTDVATKDCKNTATIAANATDSNVWAYTAKAGTHTITATSGSKSVELKFTALTIENAARNIAVDKAAITTTSGEYTTVTITVTDAWGNPVKISGGAAGDPKIAVSVVGVGLINGFNTSVTLSEGTAAGQLTFNYFVPQGQSGKGTITVTASNGDNAGGNIGQFGALAGTADEAATTAGTNEMGASVKTLTIEATSTAATAAANPALDTVKADVKAVSDTVATLSKAVTTIQSSFTELTSSFSAQIKSLSSAIAKISRAIAALSKRIK